MKSLFRSKSQSSPSKTSRFGRILSPASKSSPRGQSPPKAQQLPYTTQPNSAPIPDFDHDLPPTDFPTDFTPTRAKENEEPHNEDTPSQVGTDLSVPFDERAMTRKLMDVESSFVPEQSFMSDGERFPFSEQPDTIRSAKSQTFFKWGPGLSLPRSPSAKIDSRVVSEGFKPHGSPQEEFEAREAERNGAIETRRKQTQQQPQAQVTDEDEVDYGDSTLDSPTAAASQRYGRGSELGTQARGPYEQEEYVGDEPADDMNETRHTNDTTTQQNTPETLRAPLQDRHASYQSNASTNYSEALSESTIGADYALQTGGATSAEKKTKRPTRDDLLRLPSFGSVASSISGLDEPSVINRTTATTPSYMRTDTEDESTAHPNTSQYDMTTPRPQKRAMPDPTDTVIAQHVRDVQVPETVARQYRASHLTARSDDREFTATPHPGMSKSTLSLKEQNSKIDKLTKENFDLKLKIHFLSQALQDRSEEGVSDLISKNAQYQAELVRSKKDNQSLRRKLRLLEKQLAEQGRTSAPSTVTTSVADSEDGSGSQAVTDVGETARLRDRNLVLETENEKLVQVWQQVLDEEMDRRRAAELKAQELQRDLERYKSQRSPLRKLRLRSSRARLEDEASESNSRSSFATQDRAESTSLGGTTVTEQLKQENVNLRRDLDVQTDMLSSRNRERERLQEEIESLKLITRREESAKSSAGDSILDRSVSRQQYRMRQASRASLTQGPMNDGERDRYENMHANLRDDNVTLKMRIQDLQNEMEELEKMHVSRADASQALQEADADIQYLTDAVRHLENVLQEKDDQINGLWADLRAREDENEAFKQELVSISDTLNEVTNGREGSHPEMVAGLHRELEAANADLESMEQTLHNITAAKERLEVQQESSENEIAFLREEQETDKSKIADLQTALGNAHVNLQNEIKRLENLETLETEAEKVREESHRLRQALVNKEAESTGSLQRIQALERSLQEAKANGDSMNSAGPKDLARQRRDLEDARAELDHANSKIREQDRLIVEREDLLDQMEAEYKGLEVELSKERQARRRESAVPKDDPRIAQLEQVRTREREQYAQLLKERNDLLHSLYARLAGLCTPTWKTQNASRTDRSLASRDLPQLQRAITSALEAIEESVSSLPTRINDIERDIWADFQTLDTALNSRIKRLDHVEKAVQRAVAGGPSVSPSRASAETARLREDNSFLQKELRRLKQAQPADSFELPGLPSSGALTTKQNPGNGTLSLATGKTASSGNTSNAAAGGYDANEETWVLRIKEMNKRLTAEREGRLLDREAATKRLLEGQKEVKDLKKALGRNRQGRAGMTENGARSLEDKTGALGIPLGKAMSGSATGSDE